MLSNVTLLAAHHTMKSFDFLVMPSLLGLIAGIAHGIVAHNADLPLGLVEQMHQVVQPEHVSFQ